MDLHTPAPFDPAQQPRHAPAAPRTLPNPSPAPEKTPTSPGFKPATPSHHAGQPPNGGLPRYVVCFVSAVNDHPQYTVAASIINGEAASAGYGEVLAEVYGNNANEVLVLVKEQLKARYRAIGVRVLPEVEYHPPGSVIPHGWRDAILRRAEDRRVLGALISACMRQKVVEEHNRATVDAVRAKHERMGAQGITQPPAGRTGEYVTRTQDVPYAHPQPLPAYRDERRATVERRATPQQPGDVARALADQVERMAHGIAQQCRAHAAACDARAPIRQSKERMPRVYTVLVFSPKAGASWAMVCNTHVVAAFDQDGAVSILRAQDSFVRMVKRLDARVFVLNDEPARSNPHVMEIFGRGEMSVEAFAAWCDAQCDDDDDGAFDEVTFD
jgi:hypothetical protein